MQQIGAYNNIVAFVDNKSDLIPMLQESMRVRSPGYYFTPSYKNFVKYRSLIQEGVPSETARRIVGGQMWDGWITFYSRRGNGFFFPTGFLFCDRFRELRPLLQDRREGERSFVEPKVYGITLRDYQVEAVNLSLSAQRGIIAAATNSGKTEIAAAIISAIRKPALFITHRSNLALQTKERLRERLNLKEVSLFGASGRDFGLVTVATIQSLYTLLKRCSQKLESRPAELDLFQVVFVDEAHHSQSSQYKFVLKQLPKAFWRFGLTGTPHENTSDPKWWNFIASTGGVIYEIKNDQLIKLGISADVSIVFYVVEHSANYNQWHENFRNLIEDNMERNLLLAEIARRATPGVLIAIKTIRQGENLLKLLPEAVLLTGSESIGERAEALKRFAAGEYKIIIATSWFHEGMDVPEIRTLINASGGLSSIELLQKLGRGLRKKTDGSTLLYVDIYDRGNKHLEEHSKERCRVLQQDGHEVVIKNAVFEGN